MQTVTILRQLWSHRVLTAVAAVVAIVIGFGLQTQRHEVGVATARILVDTPDSQVVDVAPKGSDTLGVRANLLANLMVDGVVKAAIAKRAGLRPDQFAGVAESAVGTVGTTPRDPSARVLRTQVLAATDGERLPIIDVETQAPSAAAAAALANASVAGLSDYLNAKASQDPVAPGQRLRVSGLGVAQGGTEPRGPRGILVLIAMLFVFGVGCALIIGIPRLRRALREQPVDGAAPKRAAAKVAVAPVAVAPAIVEPEFIEPEIDEPEFIEPEIHEPEYIEAQIDEPEFIEAEIDEPEFIEPEIDEPEFIEPEIDGSEIDEPETVEPEIAEPEIIVAGRAAHVKTEIMVFGEDETNHHPASPTHAEQEAPRPRTRTWRLTGRRAENAAKVLEAMRAEGGKMFQADLGRAAGLSKSQRYEALKALEQAGHIRLTGEARRNRVGPPTKEWELTNGQPANGHYGNGASSNGSEDVGASSHR
ncbi:MAG TPA: hypothetical protein VH817_03860 [Thermoleophilaceae bacterium]